MENNREVIAAAAAAAGHIYGALEEIVSGRDATDHLECARCSLEILCDEYNVCDIGDVFADESLSETLRMAAKNISIVVDSTMSPYPVMFTVAAECPAALSRVKHAQDIVNKG